MFLSSFSKFSVIVMIFVFGCASPVSAQAQRLPSLDEAPWMGVFSGYARRGFHFIVNDEAQCELFILDKKKNRVGQSRKIRVHPEIIVEFPDGKRTIKGLKNDKGYATNQEASLKHEKVTLTSLTVGEAKVEMTISYSGNTVTMDGRILDRGGLKEGKLYFAYRVAVPAMYTDTYASDKKKEKSRMRRDRIKFQRAKDRKKVSLPSYKTVNLEDEKLADGGVTEISASMDGLEGRDLIFTTKSGRGVLTFGNKVEGHDGRLWQGYRVIWLKAMGADKVSPLVIEVR